MIHFHKIRFKNILSYGDVFTEIVLDQSKSTILTGKNGSGKCLDHFTQISIKINNDEILKKYKDFNDDKRKSTIGDIVEF